MRLLRSTLMLALCCAASCSAPGLVTSFAQGESARTNRLAANLAGFAKGEAIRASKLSGELGALGGEFARARRIPEILRTIPLEATRPSRGLARALELWRHETQRGPTR